MQYDSPTLTQAPNSICYQGSHLVVTEQYLHLFFEISFDDFYSFSSATCPLFLQHDSRTFVDTLDDISYQGSFLVVVDHYLN